MPRRSSPDCLVNQLLARKYRIIREIGAGGMAAVYEARHEELGKRVAVKVLYEEMSASSALVERFMREARAAAAIESPFICQVHDVGRMPEGRPFLVMDYLQGESLFERLRRVERLDTADVVRFMGQVARGLSKAHEVKILHRDLKPENIFLARDEEGAEIAKVLDFGLARIYAPLGQGAETRLTRDGTIFGTPPFMSPEQVRGDQNIDHRADLWSLACVAFECLTGRGLWDNSRGVAMVLAQIAAAPVPIPTLICPELPSAVDAFFARALERDPGLRFQDAREFARALADSLGQDPPSSAVAVFRASSLCDAVRSSESNERSDTIPAPKPFPSVAIAPAVRHPSPPNGTLASIERDQVRSPSRRPGLALGAAAFALLAVAGTVFFVGPRLLRSRVSPQLKSDQASAALAAAPTPTGTYEPLAPAASARGEGGQQGQPAASSRGACSARGLARPRAPDARAPAHHGPAAWHDGRWWLTWTEDGHGGASSGVLGSGLDDGLLATAALELSSPPATGADSRLIALDHGALLLLSAAGGEPGLRVIPLDSDGRPSTPGSIVSEGKTSASNGSIAQTAQGDVWIAYSDDPDRISSNVYARRLDSTRTPLHGAVQLTRFSGLHGPVGPRALAPALSITPDRMAISYRLERGQQHDIMFQTVLLSDPQLLSGVDTTGKSRQDVVVGSVQRITQTRLKVYAPEMACGGGGCFIGWRGQPRGTNIVAVDPTTGDVLWRAVTSSQGTGIAVGADEAGNGIVAWYDGARLRIAGLTKQGLGTASVLARVSGDQPRPSLAQGAGGWLVAWTSFEAGHTEVYATRVECP